MKRISIRRRTRRYPRSTMSPQSPPRVVSVYWHVSENFGDRLTPWLVRQISGVDATYTDPEGAVVPFLVTGSILGWSICRGIVWGAGAAFEADLDPAKLSPPSDNFRIVATRGPLSAAKARAAGHAPLSYGDPGLLLPRYYAPTVELGARVGILSSWIDYEQIRSVFGGRFAIVSALGTVESIVDAIRSWEVVVTNTLHGLVAAIAYGKPVVWTTFSDKLVGDGFKFRDFFASVGVSDPRAIRPSESWTEKEVIAVARSYQCDFVAEQIWQACPLPRCHA